MTCKMHKYEKNGCAMIRSDFTCDQVRILHLDWKKEFRDKYQTDAVLAADLRDLSYERLCEEIDEFLSQCKCQDEP